MRVTLKGGYICSCLSLQLWISFKSFMILLLQNDKVLYMDISAYVNVCAKSPF